MYPFWDSIIRPSLELLQPRTVVEIGTDAAQTTRPLAAFARERGIAVHTIDPEPKIDTDAFTREFSPHVTAHRAESLNVLTTLSPFDCVLIDGDHNWFTVIHELRIIAKAAKQDGTLPLVFLHDVGWPYARRDLYYAPDRIPDIHRQPWKRAGIDPANDALREAGFNPRQAHALHAHGIRNGVLSAVEDFLMEEPAWIFESIPGFYGLGVLAPEALYAKNPALRAFIERKLNAAAELGDHLNVLEQSRVENITYRTQLKEVWSWLDTNNAALEKAKEELEKRRSEPSLAPENQRLREEANALRGSMETLKNDMTALREEAARAARQLASLRASRSWRLTAPFRKADMLLRKIFSPRRSFPTLKGTWLALGAPFPNAARFVRHRVLGKVLPAHPPAVENATVSEALPPVAVVIPCHDYGRFLREAVDSVLAQTHKPAEIVIVDDASTDDTAAVARSYADRGVRYLRGEWRNVGAARNAGLAATTAPYLVFLDADDMLHPEYLRCGVRALERDPQAGVAYADHACFGQWKNYHRTPNVFDWEIFDAKNLINAASMMRRQAIEQAGGWSLQADQHADWVTARHVLRLGWKAVRSEGLRYYRVHGQSMTDSMNADSSYADQAGFFTEQATLCLSLSGRRWAWPLMRDFLERQTFPHRLTRLIILDTSQDPDMERDVRVWLARCDYAEITYRSMTVGLKGIADLPRERVAREIGIACSTIYNAFARMTETPLVFILEDDVIPPDDAFPRLVRSFKEDVISVSGLYWHRDKPKPVCWNWDDRGNPVFPEPASGVQPIGGTGFGCLALRGECFRRTIFQAGPPFGNYDHNFFASLTRGGARRALIDWDCVCRHYQSPDKWF